MFFYEIHEGDEDVGTAVLLGHEQRFDPDDFFALVKKVRVFVSDSYEEDTLSEAIANELQRSHGFLHVTDDLLVASVNVGETDADTYLVTQGDDARTVFVKRDENGHSGHGDNGHSADGDPAHDDDPDD
ncbi:MAG TPA: hypothetical protein VGK15_01530 [Candidatus Limnocylindria bacterium]|jgi:hypothetical protein